MRWLACLSLLILAANLGAAQQEKTSDFPKLSGPYLGQKPPGLKPELFAPGIVSTGLHEFSCCFTPDGKEFYFTRRDSSTNMSFIMETRVAKGRWTEPEVVPFVENSMSFEPRVTPDGKRMYFMFAKGGQARARMPINVWYVDRQKGGWGAAQDAGAPFNPGAAMCISATRKGTLYTTNISGGSGSECVAIARLVYGKYHELERVGPPISIGARDMYPYVAPDESYLLFDSQRIADQSRSNLFMSFRKKDGTWGDPLAVDEFCAVGERSQFGAGRSAQRVLQEDDGGSVVFRNLAELGGDLEGCQ